MQVSKLIVALTVAAGFASASFAQGAATPAPQVAPAKVEAAPQANVAKPAVKHSKAKSHVKHKKTGAKAETAPAAISEPAVK